MKTKMGLHREADAGPPIPQCQVFSAAEIADWQVANAIEPPSIDPRAAAFWCKRRAEQQRAGRSQETRCSNRAASAAERAS